MDNKEFIDKLSQFGSVEIVDETKKKQGTAILGHGTILFKRIPDKKVCKQCQREVDNNVLVELQRIKHGWSAKCGNCKKKYFRVTQTLLKRLTDE